MKKQILIIAGFLFSIILNAQVDTSKNIQNKASNEELGKMYMTKGREQKTIGWVLIGAGLALYATTYYYTNEDLSKATTPAVVGTACLLTSIPIFILSGKNKRRSQLLFQQNNLPTNFEQKGNRSIRSVGIGIPLGR